jgi:hypothetical protein
MVDLAALCLGVAVRTIRAVGITKAMTLLGRGERTLLEVAKPYRSRPKAKLAPSQKSLGQLLYNSAHTQYDGEWSLLNTSQRDWWEHAAQQFLVKLASEEARL